MRRFSQRHSFSTLSEINVTPLLDLAFVLLIIFIITTPLMDKSVDLVIPSSVAAKNAVSASAIQTVSIDRNEVIKLNSDPVGLADLTPRLEALRETTPELAVVVRTHKDLPVQKLIDIMDAVRSARITKIGVITSQGKE